jgi:hypothetical protein
MHLEEVKRIMRIPPGEYGNGAISECEDEEVCLSAKKPARTMRWLGHNNGIIVGFDDNNIVQEKRFISFSRSYSQ